jgi:hypothetical protein
MTLEVRGRVAFWAGKKMSRDKALLGCINFLTQLGRLLFVAEDGSE